MIERGNFLRWWGVGEEGLMVFLEMSFTSISMVDGRKEHVAFFSSCADMHTPDTHICIDKLL